MSVNEAPKNWFEQMEGFLDWKIIGPDLNNPFKPPISDIALHELATKRESLRKKMDLRCLCDGHEVLLIRNLGTPFLKTDHPCISKISRMEILDYLKRAGLEELILQEMERIQKEIEEELARRQIKAQEDAERRAAQGLGGARRKKKDDKEKGTAGDAAFRIMRR
jgi:hypothetical protein